MPGKKWCQYCRINLPFDKKAIQDHETTRRHLHNKQKYIKYQRLKIQRQQKATKDALKKTSIMSTANIPKAKKGSQLQHQIQQYRTDVIINGKMAINKLIAQKTKGVYGAPIDYPQKQDLLLAENYQNDQEQNHQQNFNDQSKFDMWKIDVCQETGKACFINRITQAKVYEPPIGYIMSEEQKQQWEETKKICDQIPNQNGQQVGKAGQWQQAQQQNYFDLHRAVDQQPPQPSSNPSLFSPSTFPLKQTKLSQTSTIKFQQLQPKIQNKSPSKISSQICNKINNTYLNSQQFASSIITTTLQQCRTIKQKNEIYKKLVKNDYQIKNTTVYTNYQYQQQKNEKNDQICIKPRKKVKITKILQDSDIF